MQPKALEGDKESRKAIWLLVFLTLSAGKAAAQSQSWPQWGGPNRNFKSEVKGLANA